ncbi:MAG: type IV-A pilus assembly ATPase PilB [Patescibacteria group bacterium]
MSAPQIKRKGSNNSALYDKESSFATQRGSEKEFDTVIGNIEESQALNFAKSRNLPFVSLLKRFISPDLMTQFGLEWVKKFQVVPFGMDVGGVVMLATADPNFSQNTLLANAIKWIKEELDRNSKVFFTSKTSFKVAFKQYENLPSQETAKEDFKLSDEQIEKFKESLENFSELRKKILNVPAVEILKTILAGAVSTKASDIHIDTEHNNVRIRYRVDGMLAEIVRLPIEVGIHLTQQIKIASKIELSRARNAQDGRFQIESLGRQIDLRVSLIPTQFGESIVMRLLDFNASARAIEDIGIYGDDLETLKREIEKPKGMILITGPTGSGKTSTLYSIMAKLNKPEVKIITLENPIEYHLDGISQSQVEDAGLTQAQEMAKAIRGEATAKPYNFPAALRAVMRQDPDIILVGEIRDLETADVAIQAALTGHLVLTTFHANDVPSAIPRLVMMGINTFFLQISLNALASQRLVRTVCEKCKYEYEPEKELWMEIKRKIEMAPISFREKYNLTDLEKPRKLYKGRGCDYCNNTGYKGRTGIFEIAGISDSLRESILNAKSVQDVYTTLNKGGFVSMEQNGLKLALDGVTTYDDVWRVIKT